MTTVFCPNLASPDYLDVSQCRALGATLKIYAQHTQTDPGAVAMCGPNAWPSLATPIAALSPIWLEAGAVKDWDQDGHALTEQAIAAVNQIRSAGGDVAVLAMDEPLASTVKGAFDRAPNQLPPEQTGHVAWVTANFVRTLAAAGVPCGLIEAYPYHPMARILGFVHDVFVSNGQPLAFVEMDIDTFALQDQKIQPNQVASDLLSLKMACKEYGIPMRCIITADRVTDDAGFVAQSLRNTTSRSSTTVSMVTRFRAGSSNRADSGSFRRVLNI
jgi:hypothetical protein